MKTLIENGHYRRSQHEAEQRASRRESPKKNEMPGEKMGEEGDTKDNVGIEGDLSLPVGSVFISL